MHHFVIIPYTQLDAPWTQPTHVYLSGVFLTIRVMAALVVADLSAVPAVLADVARVVDIAHGRVRGGIVCNGDRKGKAGGGKRDIY